MMVTLYQGQWYGHHGYGAVTTDPTRMAQGIMTGIGFLGAGVIMKDGLAVRGLTTAASIWISAALGILAGIGLYNVVLVGVSLALVALAAFRMVEQIFPTRNYTLLEAVYRLSSAPQGEVALRQTLKSAGTGVGNIDCAIDLTVQEQTYTITLVSGRARPEAQQIFKLLQQSGDIIRLKLTSA